MMTIPRVLLLLLALSFTTISFSQSFDDSKLWKKSSPKSNDSDPLRFEARAFGLYTLDYDRLLSTLENCPQRSALKSDTKPVRIDLPLGEDQFSEFEIYETPVMESELQAKFPEIKSYTGQGIDNPRQIVKMETGPTGFHAMIFSNEPTVLIETASEKSHSQYMVFKKNDLIRNEKHQFNCLLSSSEVDELSRSPESGIHYDPTGQNLRSYRLALATTGEYSNFHGGTKPLVLSAMVTTMNRVNAIYERDLTITMILINNTDTLIYLDPVNDPYTNNDGGTMLDENVAVIESVIGNSNYDLGHVFSTGGGGIAGLGVVCGNNKAWGVTGQGSPIGDPFDVDYVAHEIGHQFGGNHTFNSCGGQGGRPYEPGSGVTIMAYAGICNTTNLQSNSIDQFHVASYDDIITYSQQDFGNSCAVLTPTGNTPPVVDAGAGGFFIPFQTPFELTGSASDIDGDSLSYCWEQFDLGPNTHPEVALGNAPLFRTWYPDTIPTRIFPRIEDLISNRSTIGELLPQFGRDMNFRLTVRDNNSNGGGVDYDHISFQVADEAGPFRILSPNGAQKWSTGYLEAVSWDVANTDQVPVSCSRVNIFLSEDGGFTYPHLIAENVVNDGYEVIKVPDYTGDRIRLKIKAADNVFFDISNQNFSISPSTEPDFVFASNEPSQAICDDEIVIYTLTLDTILGFNDTIHLSITDNPAGTKIVFDNNDFVGPRQVQISVSRTEDAIAGDYQMTLNVQGDTIIKSQILNLKIRDGAPTASQLSFPENGMTNINGFASLTWESVPLTDSYTIQLSSNPDFSTIQYEESGIMMTSFDPEPNLEDNSVYYWRVRADDKDCGQGQWSDIYSFQTELSACVNLTTNGLPLEIPSPGSLGAPIEVLQDFEITDVNVNNILIDHRRVGQLLMRLYNPDGQSVKLIEGICNNADDYDISFDDDGLPASNIPCPPTSGLSYRPIDSLSVYNGSNALGTWILEVQDSINPSRGDLLGFQLELCGPTPSNILPAVNLLPAELVIGDSLVLDAQYIYGDCNGNSEDILFVITSLPANGDLYLNSALLAVGDSISQTSIDKNQLLYVHDGIDLEPDQLGIVALCPDAPYLGNLLLPINIMLMTSSQDIASDIFTLFPNPADGFINIKSNGDGHQSFNVAIFDVMGRSVHEATQLTGRARIDVFDLAPGIYNCQVSSAVASSTSIQFVIVR